MEDSEYRDELDRELRALHGGPEAARLSELHVGAAALMHDPEAQRFHVTQAWVYALVAGDQMAIDRLEKALRETGGL